MRGLAKPLSLGALALAACSATGIRPLPDTLAVHTAADDARAAVARGDRRLLQFWYGLGHPETPGLDGSCAARAARHPRRGVRLVSDVLVLPRTATDSARWEAAAARREAERRYMAAYNARVAALTGICATADGASAP